MTPTNEDTYGWIRDYFDLVEGAMQALGVSHRYKEGEEG